MKQKTTCVNNHFRQKIIELFIYKMGPRFLLAPPITTFSEIGSLLTIFISKTLVEKFAEYVNN